jgi:hypothetical protein
VKMTEYGFSTQRSMPKIIEELEYKVEALKLQAAKANALVLVKVCGTIQSLYDKLNGKFDFEQVGPHLDQFKSLANYLMITPLDKNILNTLNPRILCLCIISFNNLDESALFNYFGHSIRDLKRLAFELIPEKFISLIGSLESQTVTVLTETDLL